MMNTTLKIGGMHCQSCQNKISNALYSIDGISNVAVSLDRDEAEIESAAPIDHDTLHHAIANAGDYELKSIGHPSDSANGGKPKPQTKQIAHPVKHDVDNSRFVSVVEGKESYLDYQSTGKLMRLTSTYVPPANRERGIAESLTQYALEYADQQNYSVEPACSYVRNYIDHHPEYQKLLDRNGHSKTQKDNGQSRTAQMNSPGDSPKRSWLQTYKPLLMIVAYLIGGTLIVSIMSSAWSLMTMMATFMGLFFVVFSFFKMLDIEGFAKAYSSYDIVAGLWYPYGYIYPFIELTLGLLYLFHLMLPVTNLLTLVVMSISSIGVIYAVIRGREIQCGCLGTMFELPMSTVTIVEDVSMVAMAAIMLGTLT